MRVLPGLPLSSTILGLTLGMLSACSHHSNGNGSGDDAGNGAPDACVGLQCAVTNCRALSKPDTSISGTVFAPNGTLPLYGINVYVPAVDPGPLTAGATCARCAEDLPGQPVVQAISDERGHFELIGVPSSDNIPLVITSGKWRRIVTIPHVDDCAEHPLAPADTSLPRTRAEGDIPQIAITTGEADSLECLVRKLGVADSEITTDHSATPGRVHLYHSTSGQSRFKAGFPGGSGEPFSEAQTLWTDLAKMKQYDIVFFSCEGAQYPDNKPQAAMDTVKAYADYGGRVFASHWHNIWLEGSKEENQTQAPPASWTSLGTWTNRDPSELDANSAALIDEDSNPKGQSFASWMQNVGGSTVRDHIELQNQPPDDKGVVLSTGRTSLASTDTSKTERWVYLPDQGGGTQNFQFTTPIEVEPAERCGKFVFSDMHVSGTSGTDSGDYPDSCGPSTTMTPQEKALAFMFFDIASCVGILF